MKEFLLKHKKAIFYGAVAIGGIWLISNIRRQKRLAEERAKYNEMPHTPEEEKKRLSPSEIRSITKNLVTAMDGAGTYEQVIYDNLRKLNNNFDYQALLKDFGVKTISTGYLMTEKGNLPTLLRSELDTDEIEIVNAILKSKKIEARV